MNAGPSQNTSLEIRDVLVVDTDSSTADAIKSEFGNGLQTLRTAQSVDQAVLEMKRKPADVLLINVQIGDYRGLELVTQWRKAHPETEVIAMSRSQRAEICLAAWRAGASDMLFQPVDRTSIQKCLGKVIERRNQNNRLIKQNSKLRQTCRQLSKARKEIGAQVDLLCHDLVKAYQDMALQLNQTQMTGEYASGLGQELDIESMMRNTMQYILKKAGPVNAAVFLPDSEKNYVLGAYLDLDTNAETLLIDVISQTLAPYAVHAKTTVEFSEDSAIHATFAQAMLHGRSWMATASYHDGEPMAVIVAFRNQGEPFAPSVRPALESIAEVLGGKISHLVDIHNRHHGSSDSPDDQTGESPTV